MQLFSRHYIITPRLQAALHLPQPVQRVRSITARLSISFTAPLSHTFSHILQAMQETEQFLTTGAPFSLFEQATLTPADFGSTDISAFGHTETHLPHPTQISPQTAGLPFSRVIAPKGHTAAQPQKPRQPNEHSSGPD